MRILVNYTEKEKAYLPALRFLLQRLGNDGFHTEAISVSTEYNLGQLLQKAGDIKADAIVLVNEHTLKECIHNTATLDKYRGSVLRSSIPILVCNPLQHVYTVPYGSWLLEKDLQKLKTIQAPAPEFRFCLLDTVPKMRACYEVLQTAAFIAYDIETKTLSSGETLITCVSYSAYTEENTIETFVLPFITFNTDFWPTNHEYAEAITFLREANALPVPKVMHNGMYDVIHSIVYRAWPNNWVWDTMGLAHAQYAELPKSLDFVASITLPWYMQWKDEAKEALAARDIERYWRYNGKDTWYTAHIFLHYLSHLPLYAKKNYKHTFPLVYPALACAFEGFRVDLDIQSKLKEDAQKQSQSQLQSLRTMLDDPSFNPASPKQIQYYIYDVLGARDLHIGRAKKGTDVKNLRAIASQHPLLQRIIDAILAYRKDAKAISTYLDVSLLKGRLFWNLNPFGTETGRMSCSASLFWCGTQIQNIPPYAKAALVADPGYTLVEIDNSQSEARCTAYLAQEEALIAALENPEKDFYKTLGTLFFGIPYEEVTTEFRNSILKRIVHGTNYMMGAQTFLENIGTQNLAIGAAHLGRTINTEKQQLAFAQELLEAYHKPFPRVRAWYKEIMLALTTTRMLTSPLGYTRYFFGDIRKDHNILRGAVAHAPQNLSVAIVNIGLQRVWALMKEVNAAQGCVIRLKAQIHDSLLLQIQDAHLKEILPRVLDCMKNPIKVHNRTLYIPVEYKLGKTWKDMIKNAAF